MKNINFRDLMRGLLVGLIAGVGYLIGYKIVILFTESTSWAKPMEALGWLIAIPVPAALLTYFSKFLKKNDEANRITPIEPVDEDEEDDRDEGDEIEAEEVSNDSDESEDGGGNSVG